MAIEHIEYMLLLNFSKQEVWLSTFLKTYIRAFQQASDLDDTVEEKLLVGDRPKQIADSEKKLPLRERLLQRDPKESESVSILNDAYLDQSHRYF